MKLIYTHENRVLVSNVENILRNAGIDLMLKNEYAAGACGELSFLNTWPEIWLIDDQDYQQAVQIIDGIFKQAETDKWICKQCGEKNSASFELCWNCQAEKAPRQCGCLPG